MYSDLDLDPTMPNTELIQDIFISYSMFSSKIFSYPIACFNFISMTMCYIVTGSDILYCYKCRKF